MVEKWKNVRFSFIVHSANERSDESERQSSEQHTHAHTRRKPHLTFEKNAISKNKLCIKHNRVLKTQRNRDNT